MPQTSLTRGLQATLLLLREGPTLIPSKSSAVALSPLTTLVTPRNRPLLTERGAPLGDTTFKRAQVVGSTPPVLSVLAVTPTKLLSAQRSDYGTTPNRPSLSAPINNSPCGMENWSAVNGNVNQVASAPPMIYAISAQAVPHRLTELKSALELRKSLALTPYNSQTWESMLSLSGLYKKYPSLPQNLRTGFLINMPIISTTQTPPNKSIITEYQHQFVKIVSHELFKQRYIGPFSAFVTESLIGPFQTSPFSIIPKPGKPDRFRLIQNFSYPHNTTRIHPNPSINSFLDSDDFPTTWGTFSIISLPIHQLPPHSQVATRDVAEAYRTIPLHHSQWPGTVVRTGEDAFCVDVMAAFGFSPSSGVYGNVADAGADLFRSQGIGPLAKWVDDHIFFRIRRESLELYNQQRQLRHTDLSEQGQFRQGGRLWYGGRSFPDGTLDEHVEDCQFPCLDLSSQSPRSPEDSLYTYNFDDIDRLSDLLGIPWEKSKDHPFSTSTSYIGLNWDLGSLNVALTAEKRQKYSLAILDWHSRRKHDLNDVQKLYGKLLHACLVIPAGRSYLTSLEAMLVLCSPHPFAFYFPVKELAEDLSWWSLKLSAHLFRPIPSPRRLHDLHAFSDASSGFGIAITIQDRWRAWRLIPGWQTRDGQRDIGWAEAVGFELLIRSIPRFGAARGNFTVYGDNKGVVESWWNFRSRNKATNCVFRRIHSFLEQFNHSFSIHSAYVPSATNPADPPSRGIYPSTRLMLPELPLPADLDRFLVDVTLPYTPTEILLFREGCYPPSHALRIDRFLKGDHSHEGDFPSPDVNKL